MKKGLQVIALLLLSTMLFTACSLSGAGAGTTTASATTSSWYSSGTPSMGDGYMPPPPPSDDMGGNGEMPPFSSSEATLPTSATDPNIGGVDDTFGEDNSEDVNAGYFEGTTDAGDYRITYVSGTAGCVSVTDTTITFTAVAADTVYAIAGNFKGNIVIDTGDSYKFDLELHGFSLVSETTNPITVLSGSEVALVAKKDYKNYIYDKRAAVDPLDTTVYSAAVYSLVDLELGGKGELVISSDNNNGVHSKNDLQVKNLTLSVTCKDNALKGNDSVLLESGTTTLIAKTGDTVKTTNSGISTKGNQRGIITISGGTHTLYAACDGLDAAYDVVITEGLEGAPTLTIYTDKYSNYSEEVTATTAATYYVRATSNAYSFSVKYYNSDTDYVWENATYDSMVQGGRSTYYYYKVAKQTAYSKLQIYVYASGQTQGQDATYTACSEAKTLNNTYDTIAVSSIRSGSCSVSFTNYTTSTSGGMGGPGGGMNDGNTDKGTYSTKGIKAENTISISAGAITVKSYDDAVHASNTAVLENGASPLGNVNISGGTLTVYSNDDGLHADGTLTVSGGTVNVTNSYEGAEGAAVKVTGGALTILAKDDGINASGVITFGGGKTYIYCTGDGIDSNCATSYGSILFNGGDVVVISNSNGNASIDSDGGYTYTAGRVIAVMPSGGMTSEATHGKNFASVGVSKSVSLSANGYLTVTVSGSQVGVVKMPVAMSAMVVYLGSSSATVSSATSTTQTVDANGVWLVG